MIPIAIASCESQLDPGAKNPHSSAKGLFQFLDSTWGHYGRIKWGSDFASKNVLSYDDNAELGVWVVANYGTSDWNESKYCWGK